MEGTPGAQACSVTCVLRRSGTEEQYGEREQLLQEISDLLKNAGYVPRNLPRRGNGTGPRRQPASKPSATARQRLAQEISDAATASLNVSDDGETNDEPSLDGPCCTQEATPRNEGSLTRPSQQVSAANPSPLDTTHGEQATEESEVDEQARGPVPPQKRQRQVRAVQTGIRGLQGMGLELLTRREENDFILRQKEIELQHRRLDNDEKHLALEEKKVFLFEETAKTSNAMSAK